MGREVTVAYENQALERASRRGRKAKLKWHRADGGGLTSKGERGEYCIIRQRADRRHGIYRWGVTHNGHSVGSTEDLAGAKGLAAHHEFKQSCAESTAPTEVPGAAENRGRYRAQFVKSLRLMGEPDPEGFANRHEVDVERYELAGVEPNIAAAILVSSRHHRELDVAENGASESPTRGEWEVVVTNPPREHRGHILSMAGPGYGHAEGNKIYLTGFYDDEEARRVANSISRKYQSQVTYGPRRKMEAAEDSHPGAALAEESQTLRAVTACANSAGLAFVPDVVERLEKQGLTVEQAKAEILRLDRENVISLQPDDNMGRLTAKQKQLSIRGYDGTKLSWIHLRVRGGAEEQRRRPGAAPKETTEECEHGCPTGECEPFTKLSRDPRAFDACMKRAKEIGELDTSRKLYDLIHHELGSQDREVFGVVCIDFRGQLRDFVILSVGQRHRVAVDIEDILQVVILSGSDGFAVCHSHPSGNAEPSQADRQLTKSIEKAAAVACPNVKMVDHIVCGNRSYYSFADKKIHKVS